MHLPPYLLSPHWGTVSLSIACVSDTLEKKMTVAHWQMILLDTNIHWQEIETYCIFKIKMTVSWIKFLLGYKVQIGVGVNAISKVIQIWFSLRSVFINYNV